MILKRKLSKTRSAITAGVLAAAIVAVTGCGGNGGGSVTVTGPATTTPGGTTAQAALPAAQQAGFTATSVTTKQIIVNGQPETVTASTADPVSVSNALSTAITANGLSIIAPVQGSTGTFIPQTLNITAAQYNAFLQTYFQQLAALPGNQAVHIGPGDQYVTHAYTLPDGSTVSVVAIEDAQGKVIFDGILSLIPPSQGDTTHYITQHTTANNTVTGSVGVYNPADGHLMFSDTGSATRSVDANGNLLSPPATISVNPPVLGPGEQLTSQVQITFSAAKGIQIHPITRQGNGCQDGFANFGVDLPIGALVLWSNLYGTEYEVCPNTGINGGSNG